MSLKQRVSGHIIVSNLQIFYFSINFCSVTSRKSLPKYQDGHLEKENQELQKRSAHTADLLASKEVPPAEEQDRQQEAGRHHVRVFAQKEHAELERTVFRVVTADQLLLRFRQVEGQAIALGQDTGEEEQKCQRLIPDVPMSAYLVVNDPLTDNSKGYKWDESSFSSTDSCGFTNGAYHIIEKTGLICIPEASNLVLSNFAFGSSAS